jgi:hypothetical protein
MDAIREVATTELRATPEAVALLHKTMESLTSMSVDSPIVTLFQRESQSASTARFQMTLVEHDDAGKLRVQLLGFGLNTAKTVTQVLLLKRIVLKYRLKRIMRVDPATEIARRSLVELMLNKRNI